MNKNIRMWLFFIISYIISQLLIFLLSKDNFLKSPMYIFLPIFAYFATYFLADSIKKFTKLKTLTIIISFIMLCIISQYLALYIFNLNTYTILNDMAVSFNFFKIFLDSVFLEFMIAGVFGFIAKK